MYHEVGRWLQLQPHSKVSIGCNRLEGHHWRRNAMCKLACWVCRTGCKSCVVSQMECVHLLVVYDSGWVPTQWLPNRDGMVCRLKDANPSTRGTKMSGHRVLGREVCCCSDSHPSMSWARGRGGIQHLPHSCRLSTCPARVTEQWLRSWVVGQLQLPHQHRRNTTPKRSMRVKQNPCNEAYIPSPS